MFPRKKFTVPAVVKFNAAVVKLNCCFFPRVRRLFQKEPFVSIFYQFSQLWTEDNGLDLPESRASSKTAKLFMFWLFWDLAAVSSPQASPGICRLIAITEWPAEFRGDKRKRWLTVSRGRGHTHKVIQDRSDMERFRDVGPTQLAFTVNISEPASTCDTTAAPKTGIKHIGLVLNAISYGPILNSEQNMHRHAQIFLIKCLVRNRKYYWAHTARSKPISCVCFA